jgi:hypothetical protein
VPELSELIDNDDMRAKLEGWGITDVGKLAEEYVRNQKDWSTSVRVPSAQASKEDWSKYYEKIGRPESTEGYATPAESETARAILESIKGEAHNAGLTKAQWEAVAKAFDGAQSTMDQAQRSAADQWAQKAQEKWGEKLGEVVAKGRTVMDKLIQDDPSLKEVLDDSGLANHPSLIEYMARIADLTGPDTAPTSMDGARMGGSKEEAVKLAQEAREIFASPEMRQKSHPGRQAAMHRFMTIEKSLQKMGYSGGTTDPALTVDDWG